MNQALLHVLENNLVTNIKRLRRHLPFVFVGLLMERELTLVPLKKHMSTSYRFLTCECGLIWKSGLCKCHWQRIVKRNHHGLRAVPEKVGTQKETHGGPARWEGHCHDPRKARSHQKLVESRKDSPARILLPKEPAPPAAWFWVSGLKNGEGINFCCVKLLRMC